MKSNNAKKYGLTDKDMLDKFEHKMIMRIKSYPTYRNLQVYNDEIWGDVMAVLLFLGQGNDLLES